MKRLIGILVVLSLLSGCVQSTEYGECIGVQETPNPNLVYEWPISNIIIMAIFSESLIVPIWGLLDWAKCPIRGSNEASVPTD